jgi:hypothetical protein
MFNTQKNQVKQHTALGLTAQKSPQQSQAGWTDTLEFAFPDNFADEETPAKHVFLSLKENRILFPIQSCLTARSRNIFRNNYHNWHNVLFQQF